MVPTSRHHEVNAGAEFTSKEMDAANNSCATPPDGLEGRAYIDAEGNLQLHSRAPYKPNEKLRRAYVWISTTRILCPYYDIQFNTTPISGPEAFRVDLDDGEGYASFILLPILTLMISGRMLIIGGVGRGKTSLATLMGMLVGYSHEELRKAIQHGHPQLTTAELLGAPLPSDLVRATSLSEVRVSWRRWIEQRVKIIDEYNRIPTKTQSALLSLLSEGYAEAFEQTVSAGQAAWFLTANDDIGGGTFPVIDALRDRIEIVSRCTPVTSSLLQDLANQIISSPSDFVPADIILTDEDLRAIQRDIESVPASEEALDLVGSFLAHLDFCRQASRRIEYMSKDTIRLAGRRIGQVCNEDCPLDKRVHVCTQVDGGVSIRVFQSLIRYAKALAYFRQKREATIEDFAAMMPWVLNEKVRPNPSSAFFQEIDNAHFLIDQISWINQAFTLFGRQYSQYRASHPDVVGFRRKLENPLAKLTTTERAELCDRIEDAIATLLSNNEMNGFVHSDLVLLKNMHHMLVLELRAARSSRS
jgi:MoxR-like ATPase